MASPLTGNDVGDLSQVAPLMDQIEATPASVTADGAYDGMPTHEVVAARRVDIRVIIPPHVTAVLSAPAERNPSQRDQHILFWQEEADTDNTLWLKPDGPIQGHHRSSPS